MAIFSPGGRADLAAADFGNSNCDMRATKGSHTEARRHGEGKFLGGRVLPIVCCGGRYWQFVRGESSLCPCASVCDLVGYKGNWSVVKFVRCVEMCIIVHKLLSGYDLRGGWM